MSNFGFFFIICLFATSNGSSYALRLTDPEAPIGCAELFNSSLSVAHCSALVLFTAFRQGVCSNKQRHSVYAASPIYMLLFSGNIHPNPRPLNSANDVLSPENVSVIAILVYGHFIIRLSICIFNC